MIHKLFDDTIKILILLNKKNRNTNQNLYSFSDYAQEYCTVKCDVGRQIGKSTYIKTHADDQSVVVVMNDRMKQNFFIKNRKFDLRSPSDLLNNPQKEYKTIYIDEPRWIFINIPISNFYYVLSKSYNQTYIWLGM